MSENRLFMIAIAIFVIVVGGALLIKRQRATPATNTDVVQDSSIDVSAIPQDQLDTETFITEVITAGTGEVAKVGDTVSMHYRGVITDGSQFDSSYDRGEPFQFTIGEGSVIQGWEQGVPGMQVGEKRRIVINPSLGYGETERPGIPANSTLIFEVELMEII